LHLNNPLVGVRRDVSGEQSRVTRSHRAVFQWVHRGADTALNPPTASPSKVAVDEHAGKVGTEQQWLYAAIDVEMKRLGSVVSDQRGTDLAVGALVRLAEKIRLLSRRLRIVE